MRCECNNIIEPPIYEGKECWKCKRVAVPTSRAGLLGFEMRKRRFCKGQAGFDWLMTYGLALLVVAIVGAALISLGVINVDDYKSPSHYSSSSYVCTNDSMSYYKEYRLNLCGNMTQYSTDTGVWYCLLNQTICNEREWRG